MNILIVGVESQDGANTPTIVMSLCNTNRKLQEQNVYCLNINKNKCLRIIKEDEIIGIESDVCGVVFVFNLLTTFLLCI